MKRLIILFAFIILSYSGFCKEKQDSIGYYCYVQKCGEVYDDKFQSLDSCYIYITQFYPDFCADLNYILECSPYYRENCYMREIYVEKMRINKHGKYKRIKHFKNYLK